MSCLDFTGSSWQHKYVAPPTSAFGFFGEDNYVIVVT